MPEKNTLADFQDALIELLSSVKPEGDIFEILRTDPRFDHYREYVNDFDPDMVAVACELMGKWAKLKDENEE